VSGDGVRRGDGDRSLVVSSTTMASHRQRHYEVREGLGGRGLGAGGEERLAVTPRSSG
jgi:hypothetical protein